MHTAQVRQVRYQLRLELCRGEAMVMADDCQAALQDEIMDCVDSLQQIFNCKENYLAVDAARKTMEKILRRLEK